MINTFPLLTSRQNTFIIDAVKLRDKKHRDKRGVFIFEGVKLFREAVGCGLDFEFIMLNKSFAERADGEFERDINTCTGRSRVRVNLLEDGLFDRISCENSPSGIICGVKYIDKSHKFITIDIDGKNFAAENSGVPIFLLDQIGDPGNLGTIIRSAAAFGVGMLVLSRGCADIYNEKTVRAAMGGLFRQNVAVADDLAGLTAILRRSGRRVFAAAPADSADCYAKIDSAALNKLQLRPDDCFVVGNEGHGICAEIIAECDARVFIPMAPGAESLNAAASAAIFMWEMKRL